ncbi:putative phosphatidylinositol-4-phosphate 5-kinase [Monocercomonoides exilis]|uniref:putative phosphatidylinositol-4-phosphate 5-kinase n=1 Tax=Monocercomonoides exilis TaxID=2049356 RepID=UPI00355A204B|nr:putative phosphatidylinositol-4-phosphate 5-kinase [Monocercomonoides exilis]|eukprot:MONOS_7196.2-p1 / transcript=MONOS_7196.2 / gene=MONOS_7196 / organism=Monocercomonoides_exilis_PA203 / gene_product=phosphatidylinositol-4-phosphate 5-kinase, 11335-7537 / transcript_product=phosphatidylinositol-4-phosphate 5-kinase, 11335-7537 / location=Mono_scaffold00240:60923-64055(-) / protein_length=688 / sequence_SO=supercontig / SO=protein_coding / is_pseudo=false
MTTLSSVRDPRTSHSKRATFFRYENGDEYNGEVVRGMRHGRGSYSYKDGRHYKGEWKENLFHGKGTLTYPSGKKYEGMFERGQFVGNVKLTFPNGDVYEGELAGLKIEGKGKMIRKVDRTVYEGEWKGQKPHGEGTMVVYGEDGKELEKYVGEWKEGLKHGKGILISKDGREYEGEFKEDKSHGNGCLKYPNGNVYTGTFVNGQRSGYGKLSYRDGRLYEGDWRDNAANGQGTFHYTNGDVYTGGWKDTRKHGKGELRYKNGDVFEGVWTDGEAGGRGVFTFANNDQFTGNFEKGLPKGEGTLVTAFRISFNGIWDGLSGHGEIIFDDGSKRPFIPRAKWSRKTDGVMTYVALKEGDSLSGSTTSESGEDEEDEEESEMEKERKKKEKEDALKIYHTVDYHISSIQPIDETLLTGGVKIGSGGFGEVYKGYYTGAVVAWKTLNSCVDQDIMKDFLREAALMQNCQHPNIVHFFGYTPPPTMRIVMEYANHGTLHSYIHETKENLDAYTMVDFANQIASGMTFLHYKKIIHKDLKPLNVLLNELSSGSFRLMISDFGLSKITHHSQTLVLHKGTPQYTPPEGYSEGKVNEKLDVFSFGMIMWEMWKRELPFRGLSNPQLMNLICSGQRPSVPRYPPSMDDTLGEYSRLLQQCWAQDPNDRPSFAVCSKVLTSIKERIEAQRRKAAMLRK